MGQKKMELGCFQSSCNQTNCTNQSVEVSYNLLLKSILFKIRHNQYRLQLILSCITNQL